MISEVEKIKQGLVEKTVEFDTQRKVIGVSTTNLLPNENYIYYADTDNVPYGTKPKEEKTTGA